MNVIERELSWKEKELQFELVQLQREKLHLVRKKQERALTSWESERIKDIVAEHLSAIQVLESFSR